MNRLLYLICLSSVLLLLTPSCSQFNKGVIAKKELRAKKTPSIKIREEYQKQAKKQTRRLPRHANPKKEGKRQQKASMKMKKRGDRYLKRKRRRQKRA